MTNRPATAYIIIYAGEGMKLSPAHGCRKWPPGGGGGGGQLSSWVGIAPNFTHCLHNIMNFTYSIVDVVPHLCPLTGERNHFFCYL